MFKLKSDYQYLYKQLSNMGEETSYCEFMWNENIMVAIDNLFEDVSDDVKKKIILNHV